MKDRLEVALTAAKGAGEILLEQLSGPAKVEFKGEVNLVTEADREAETAIVGVLRQAFPDDEVLSEEGGGQSGKGEYSWLIDPLDGTTNFAHQYPIFSISIGLRRGEEIVAGVVYDPTRQEWFVAERGRGARLNDQPLRVSTQSRLNESLLATGFPYDLRESPVNNLDYYERFVMRAQAVRRAGSAALDLSYVAAGRLDGYWELKLAPWDTAAGILMVEEAGGRVSDFQGREFRLEDGWLVASNGLIHEEMLEVLAVSGQRSAISDQR